MWHWACYFYIEKADCVVVIEFRKCCFLRAPYCYRETPTSSTSRYKRSAIKRNDCTEREHHWRLTWFDEVWDVLMYSVYAFCLTSLTFRYKRSAIQCNDCTERTPLKVDLVWWSVRRCNVLYICLLFSIMIYTISNPPKYSESVYKSVRNLCDQYITNWYKTQE